MKENKIVEEMKQGGSFVKPPHKAWLYISNGLLAAATVSFLWLIHENEDQKTLFVLFLAWFSYLAAYWINSFLHHRFVAGLVKLSKVDVILSSSMLEDIKHLTKLNRMLSERLEKYESDSS